jgi:hypothetical protein
MRIRSAAAVVLAAICLHTSASSAQELISIEDYPVTTGYVIEDYPIDGRTPLLSWFDFGYVFSDHHLRQMFVRPMSNDTIHLSYMDDDGEDTIGYSVGHWALDGVPWRSVSGSCPEVACKVQLGNIPADSEFVLIGFSVWFKNSDHHLRRLLIQENDGELTVWLGDKNSDDPVGFRVDFSWVPQDEIVATGQWGDGDTESIFAPDGEIPDGPIVLRGFSANYIDLDHHVTRFAVYPDQISLYDKNRDDAMRGSVRWAQLRTWRNPFDPPLPPIFENAR